jgi:hypothetical protein
MEDLLGVLDQPNVPGTVHEHPNWRRRLPAGAGRTAHDKALPRCRFMAAAAAPPGNAAISGGCAACRPCIDLARFINIAVLSSLEEVSARRKVLNGRRGREHR